jgi:hypothetical protein
MPLRYRALPSEIDRRIQHRPPLHLFVLPDARRGGSVCGGRRHHVLSNRTQLQPPVASKDDPSEVAETGGAEQPIAEQSRSWRAEIGEREVTRGS